MPNFAKTSSLSSSSGLDIGGAQVLGVVRETSAGEYRVAEPINLNKRFIANDRGRVVAIFLIKYFQKYVQYDFTADLENQLDEISGGRLNWIDVINKFWNNFKPTVDETIGKRNLL